MGIVERHSIRGNYLRVIEEIEKAASQAGRELSSVKVVVVTKGHPDEAVQEAIEAGARLIGENYAEEGIRKMEALGQRADLEWHMIGHVQSRKARLVCENFDWLHSLDSLRLAERLERFAAELELKLPVLLECNVSGEESKFGWRAWEEERWNELEVDFASILDLPHLVVRGLMTMAPFFDEAEAARPYFKRLRRLRDCLSDRLPKADWRELSMGMSGDYVAAIQEGATLVRIGTAIMGERHTN
jgi:hypothetical protein